MIDGKFGDNGELIFELELLDSAGERFTVEGLWDTGFTTGWLAIDSQDVEVLGWSKLASQVEMISVQGTKYFDIYAGRIIIDSYELTIAVHVGENIPEILLGRKFLQMMELVVNEPKGILTLSIVQY
ncbi:MAG: aspartyl protease [Hormoscilla sp. GM102CHS1]|nr:aspartyl protease [Hormoscilla sp. GM102CHS1]